MDFSIFRPAAPSASAVAEALERAKVMQAGTEDAIAVAKNRRDSLLLDGEPAELAAAEAALGAAREGVERAAAVVAQLSTRLVTAQRDDTLQRAVTTQEAAEEAVVARAKWWKKTGPQLQALMREGYRLEEAARDAGSASNRAVLQATDVDPTFTTKPIGIDPQDTSGWWREFAITWAKGRDLDMPNTTLRLRLGERAEDVKRLVG